MCHAGRLISLGIDTATATEIVATPNLYQSPQSEALVSLRSEPRHIKQVIPRSQLLCFRRTGPAAGVGRSVPSYEGVNLERY